MNIYVFDHIIHDTEIFFKQNYNIFPLLFPVGDGIDADDDKGNDGDDDDDIIR